MVQMTTGGFHRALAAQGRSQDIPEAEDVYGWLIGSWELEVPIYYNVDVASKLIKGEAHFGWVLEGRAMQDIWMVYQSSRQTGDLEKMITYGTTFRLWDPAIQAWRITWTNPARNHREEQIGRRSGKDIVQIGARPNGTVVRWMFTEITPRSFHWLGEALPDGKTWTLEAEFLARRMSP